MSTKICFAIDADGPAALDRLRAALDTGPAASVLVAPGRGGALDPSLAGPLVELAQSRGAAALIVGDASLAKELKADGVHLPWSPDAETAFAEARRVLGAGAIAGADAGGSRHDAMCLGEAGADYIAIGWPSGAAGDAEARELRREFSSWWAELFEVPGMALDVATAEDARDLAATGIDFIAVALAAGLGPSEAARRAADIRLALEATKRIS